MAILDAFVGLLIDNYVFLLLTVPLIPLISDFILWKRMPPGPQPFPLVGNKYHVSKSKPWIQFEEWSRKFGPIFTIWIGRRPTIVISDPQIAQDLLEKRSTKYSSRPRMIAMGELLWEGNSILVQPYGKSWSLRRKLLHQAMTAKALQSYMPVQQAEASRLCFQLLNPHSNWERQFERFTGSIVFTIAYGHRIDSLESAVIRQRFKFMSYAAGLNVPGKYLVESIPLLRYIPNALAPWKRDIKEHGKAEAAANMALVNVVRSDIKRATETGTLADLPPSLCRTLLEIRDKESHDVPLTDQQFSYIPASLFGAGSDTTASTLCTAVLALITHTNTLQSAREELDIVVGPDRTPNFSDQKNLPYMQALIKEVLRWRPVAVLGGTPHASTENDRYRGYFIPKGTTVLGNSWAINLNSDYYPNPHLFEPRRFLDSGKDDMASLKGNLSHPSKSGHSSFGWGRRVCPGAELASNSLFIALAKLIWAFDILPLKGKVYDTFDYTDGFNIRPKSFQCMIKIRSDAHKNVLEEDMKNAESILDLFPTFEE